MSFDLDKTVIIRLQLLKGMNNPTEILEKIIEHGMSEMRIKFPAYGNSYLDTEKLNLKFWKKRLTNEVSEYEKSPTSEERIRKLVNIFNLTWMAYNFEFVAPPEHKQESVDIGAELFKFEQQLYCNGYMKEKDIPLFNAIEALRRRLV